jgi:thiamine biosynthesis lipoprotein
MNRLFLPSLTLILMFACGKKQQNEFSTYKGYAQGTTFLIEVDGENDYSTSIDSILKSINKELSLWDSLSWISAWNSGKHHLPLGPHALYCWQLSENYYWQSDGYFDPSLGPLIQFWGFGSSKKGFPEKIDTLVLNQVRNLVGLQRVLQFDSLRKLLSPSGLGVNLDFNAIAQGYSVDVVADFLEKNGHNNYMVEIGGEVRCRGRSPQNEHWKIGIDKPVSKNEDRTLQAIVKLEGGLATSGSYRKFYEKGSKKYAHVIDPMTGFPVSHQLVSVTVSARTAAQADAMATALLAMGTQPAIAFSKNHPDLGVFLIYEEAGEWQTWVSEKMQDRLVESLK